MHDLLPNLPEQFLATTGRATALVASGCLLAALLARAAAATRRRLWAGVLIALILLPVATALLPPLHVGLLPAGAPAAAIRMPEIAGAESEMPPPGQPTAIVTAGRPARAGTAATSPTPEDGGASPGLLLLALWLAGLVALAARTAAGHRRAARLVAEARPVETAAAAAGLRYEIRCSAGIDLPMTVGLLRPVVLVPPAFLASWSADRREMVLLHETAHVRGGDPLLQVVAEVACALHWFNPLVWLAARRLRIERELAADDAALLAGTRPSAYARCLLELSQQSGQALPPPSAAVVSLLHPAGLKARLLGVLDGRRPRAGRPAATAALALLGAAVFLPVALAVPARLPAPAPQVDRAPATATGPVLGRAIDGRTGRPVAGAEVDLYLQRYSPTGSVRVASDEQGLFRLPQDAPAPKRFVAYLRSGALAARTPIMAPPATGEPPAPIALRPTATLAGTVRSETGEPLAGARLRFYGAESWAVSPGRDFEVQADRAGQVQLEGILHGNYRLVVQSPQGTWGVLLLRVGTGETAPFSVIVPERQPVTGRLLDESGNPIANARLTRRLLPPLDERRYFGWDETDGEGRFRMLPLGHPIFAQARTSHGEVLTESFSDGGEAHLVEGGGEGSSRLTWVTPAGSLPGWIRSSSRAPNTVVLGRAVHVSGTVRWPDGRPAAGALVSAFSHRNGGISSGVDNTTVDAEGRYRLGPLSAGRLTVFARLPGVPPGEGRALSVQSLAPAGSEQRVDVVLPAARP